MQWRGQRFRFWIAAAASVAALTGCSTQEQPSYLTAAEITKDYHSAAQSWDLPPGSTWPAKPYDERGPDGAEIRYERGMGSKDASFDWWCLWIEDLRRAKTDDQRATAREHVLRIRDTPFYNGLPSEDRSDFDKDVVTPAQSGNYSGVMNVAEQSCR